MRPHFFREEQAPPLYFLCGRSKPLPYVFTKLCRSQRRGDHWSSVCAIKCRGFHTARSSLSHLPKHTEEFSRQSAAVIFVRRREKELRLDDGVFSYAEVKCDELFEVYGQKFKTRWEKVPLSAFQVRYTLRFGNRSSPYYQVLPCCPPE